MFLCISLENINCKVRNGGKGDKRKPVRLYVTFWYYAMGLPIQQTYACIFGLKYNRHTGSKIEKMFNIYNVRYNN